MKTILLDLDGTLLPMDEEAFTKVYFNELCIHMAPYGFQPEQLIQAIWAGTKAMVKNDGSKLNCDVFWDTFVQLIPCDVADSRAKTDAFYLGAFDRAKTVVGDVGASRALVMKLKEKGYDLVLATNPVFPMVAVGTRLRWIGLQASDFKYITTYENSRFCKPHLNYYRGILEACGLCVKDAMMIGNNVGEDMCFAELGGDVFLVTDHLENPKGLPYEQYPQGTMDELRKKINEM